MSSSSRSSTTRSRIAVAQLRSTSSKLHNLLDIAKCAGKAKKEGCSVIFLPECFGFMGESSDQTLQQAEPPLLDNSVKNEPSVTNALKDTVQASSQGKDLKSTELTAARLDLLDGLRTIASESNLWISAGGMHVSGAPSNDEDKPRVYNTHLVLDPHGTIQAVYHKMHLFDVSIPGKVNLRESATTAPGTQLCVCESPVGKLGLSTCYDVRFPEMYVELVKQGAEILLVPSAFTVPTGTAHWHTLLRARAIENQCYVVAAAQFGQHNAKRESYGHSLVVDPWGKIVADAGGSDGMGTLKEPQEPPSIITCDIDIDAMQAIRQRMPMQMHREKAAL